MKRILVLAALAACGDNYATQTPDAGSLLVDATTSGDAAQRLQQGCNMGNLPAFRTITLTPSDSAPSGLLNELQDAVIGGFFGPQQIYIGADNFCLEAGAGTLSNGIWTMATTGTNKLSMALQIPVGAIITRLDFFWGPGPTTTAVIGLRKLSMIDGGVTNTVRTITGVGGGAWGFVGITNSGGAAGTPVLPETVAAFFSYTAEITFSASTPAPQFSGVSVSMNKSQ